MYVVGHKNKGQKTTFRGKLKFANFENEYLIK